MIPIDNITDEALVARFESLPDALKGALSSDANLDAIAKICHDHYIQDEEKILIVQQIVALVLLGLVHAMDLGTEINLALFLDNPKLANALADEIDKKVFALLGDELKNSYHPLLPENNTPKAAPAPSPDDILQKIRGSSGEKPIIIQGAPPEAPKPAIPSKIFTQPVNIPIVGKDLARPMPAYSPMAKVPPAAPVPPRPSASFGMPPAPPAPKPGETIPSKPPAEGTPAKPAVPAPVIIHQETEIAPTERAPMERPNNPSPKNLVAGAPRPATSAPSPVARLEYEKKEEGSARIVNYSAEENMPIAPRPAAPNVPPASRPQPSGIPAPSFTPKAQPPVPPGSMPHPAPIAPPAQKFPVPSAAAPAPMSPKNSPPPAPVALPPEKAKLDLSTIKIPPAAAPKEPPGPIMSPDRELPKPPGPPMPPAPDTK